MPRRVHALLLAALLAATPAFATDPPPTAAPNFSLPARAGTAALDSLRGTVVVLDFWASWCTPCRQSFPWLAQLQARHGERGLRVVAINMDKSRAAAERFLAAVPAPFTIAFDPTGKTAEAYRVSGMPTTILIGRDGTIRHRHVGFDPRKRTQYEAAIEEALRP